MQFLRSHAWTPLQRWLIVIVSIVALAACSVGIYSYERYYRGPSESALFGTWEEWSDAGRSHYSFKPDHTFEVIDPDAPFGPLTFARGRWYAGGRFVYLRFHVEDPWDREFIVWRIDDISPSELRIRYNPHSPIHGLKRIESGSPHASNQAMQPTAGRSDAPLHLMKTRPLQFALAPASGG